MKIPFFNFQHMHSEIQNEMTDAFKKVYHSNWFVLGESVSGFETNFSRYLGTAKSVGVANGLDALHICLLSLDIGEGDEVIVPSNTYIATWLAVSYTGAKIVPVEPREETFNLNPDLLEEAITTKTKAIMPVHLFGQACEMGKIMDIANAHHLRVIEDNSQAQGALWNGQRTGSFGDINGTSLYPAKNLGALGDAGVISTNDKDLAGKATILRNYGSQRKYYNQVIGYNSRLDELHAAFLNVKLKYLDQWNEQRAHIAKIYDELLQDIEQLTLPSNLNESQSVYHQFVIKLEKRDALANHLNEKGIGTLIHYPIPPHLQQAYQHLQYQAGDFPIAEKLANTSLSLPIYPGLSEDELTYICDTIRAFFQ